MGRGTRSGRRGLDPDTTRLVAELADAKAALAQVSAQKTAARAAVASAQAALGAHRNAQRPNNGLYAPYRGRMALAGVLDRDPGTFPADLSMTRLPLCTRAGARIWATQGITVRTASALWHAGQAPAIEVTYNNSNEQRYTDLTKIYVWVDDTGQVREDRPRVGDRTSLGRFFDIAPSTWDDQPFSAIVRPLGTVSSEFQGGGPLLEADHWWRMRVGSPFIHGSIRRPWVEPSAIRLGEVRAALAAQARYAEQSAQTNAADLDYDSPQYQQREQEKLRSWVTFASRSYQDPEARSQPVADPDHLVHGTLSVATAVVIHAVPETFFVP